MLNIRCSDQPARFGFGLTDTGNFAIDIEPTVWSEAVAFLTPEVSQRFQPTHIADRQYVPPTERRWGFGPVLTTGSAPDGWVRVVCPLPVMFDGNRQDFSAGCAVSATLNFLLKILNYWEFTPISNRLQLITIDAMMAEPEFHGAALSGKVSPAMTEWTRRQSVERQRHIESTMCLTYNRMVKAMTGKAKPNDFVARYHQGTIILFLPGFSTDLGCDGASLPEEGEGYGLVSHNTDSVVHQLTFLVALATIHDLARKDLWAESIR